MKIIAKRGDYTYIVQLSKSKYLLVSTDDRSDIKPAESNTPDTFLRAGYFEQWKKNVSDESDVVAVLKKWSII